MSSTLYMRPSTMFDLDIDELIREVHYRPAIWNKNCVGYTDRRLKARMWDEVCENIVDNWKKLKILQKNTISNEVQKKWRNVKDAYKKEHKKIIAGQDLGKKRQYIHFKALSFLSNSERYISGSAVSVDYSDDESDNTSTIDQDNTSTSSGRKRTRKKNHDEDDSLKVVKREKFHFDEENSNSENNKQNVENNIDNLLEIECEKPDFSGENTEVTHKKAHNRDRYSDRQFVEIKYDDWEREVNTPIDSKRDDDKHFVKIHGDVKVYDEDISFTEMMVPMLRKLNDDQKHFAKVEILNILHRAKRYHPLSSSETQTDQVRSEEKEEVEKI